MEDSCEVKTAVTAEGDLVLEIPATSTTGMTQVSVVIPKDATITADTQLFWGNNRRKFEAFMVMLAARIGIVISLQSTIISVANHDPAAAATIDASIRRRLNQLVDEVEEVSKQAALQRLLGED